MTEEGESEFFQTSDSTFDPSTSGGSSFDEKGIKEEGDEGVLTTIKQLKCLVLGLSMSLVVSILVAIVFLIFSIYLVFFRNDENTLPEKITEGRYLYPFERASVFYTEPDSQEISKIEEGEDFHCHARCEIGSLSYFLAHNKGILDRTFKEGLANWEKTDQKGPRPSRDDAGTALKIQILDKFAHICRMSGIAAETKQKLGEKEAVKHFRDAADKYCGNFAGVENQGDKIFYLCRSDPYYTECRAGSECWDSGFHEKYLPEATGLTGGGLVPPDYMPIPESDTEEIY